MAVKELLDARSVRPIDSEEQKFWNFLSDHSNLSHGEANTAINIHTINYKSLTAGPGMRTEIFLQGCNRDCPGCFSSETHPTHEGDRMTVLDVLLILRPSKNKLTSYFPPKITFGGGEPLLQLEALSIITRTLKEWYDECHILVYTGYSDKDIEEMPLKKNKQDPYPYINDLLESIDVMVTEEYIEDKRYDLLSMPGGFIGSSNQKYYLVEEGELTIYVTAERANETNSLGDLGSVEDRYRNTKKEYLQATEFLVG